MLNPFLYIETVLFQDNSFRHKYTCLSVKTVLFQTIYVRSLVLFDVSIGPNQVLPLQARVDLGAMAMKWYLAVLKAPTLLESYHLII